MYGNAEFRIDTSSYSSPSATMRPVSTAPRRQEEEHAINMVERDPIPRNDEEANDVSFHFSGLASF